jgi:hypothetical protein
LKSYVALHGTWVAMYAFLGKGFAYAGWQPFYVGELLLLLALPVLFATRRIGAVLNTPLGLLMACFLAWQTACMLPYLAEFGTNALRDSVIWGYAAFACVTATLVLRLRGLLKTILRWYPRFARFYLFLGPAVWLATLYLRDWLPRWPGTSVTVPLVKGDEYCVHLAGILAFLLSGIGKASQWWVFLLLADAMLGMSVRSGLAAFVVACGFVLLLRPQLGRLLLVSISGVTLILAMIAFDLRFVTPVGSREFSLDQLKSSLISVVSDSERSDLESTKSWRLIWWRAIRDYTVSGPYFWTGKGYGINLADSDGFQVGTREEPLRSPHSSHVTFLARSGVPGFLLWGALQLFWAAQMLRCYFRARSLRSPVWSGLFAWLLAYWTAFMVSAGFDVFLEGPMAGIPFWTLFGLGWGAQIHFCSQLARRGLGSLAAQTREPAGAYSYARAGR